MVKENHKEMSMTWKIVILISFTLVAVVDCVAFYGEHWIISSILGIILVSTHIIIKRLSDQNKL